MTVVIRGKRYGLEFVPAKDLPRTRDGDCDPPNVPNKKIRVYQSLKGRRRLEIICHECLHAGHWDLSEEAIQEMADDLSRILDRLGYRWSDTE